MLPVVAAAVRNRWGETSTPRVSNVILEIKLLGFLWSSASQFGRISRRSLSVPLIQADRGVTVRDTHRSRRSVISGIGRSSNLRASGTCRARRSTSCLNFFEGVTDFQGCKVLEPNRINARTAIIRPLRTPWPVEIVFGKLFGFGNQSQSGLCQPLREDRRSNFDLGSMASARSFWISASQE